MIDYRWNYLLFIFAFLIAYIDKYFFMKDGIILSMDGIFPKKIGNRTEDSKWARILSIISSSAAIILAIDMFIKFLQQEADKIQQQIGNLQ